MAAVWLLATGLVGFMHRERPIWYDEAWVVEFAMEPSAREALGATLERKQPAAAGYMAVMHWVEPWGTTEPARYRWVSLVSGMALVLTGGWLAARWTTGWRSLGFAAAGFLLLCPFLQRYFTEIKQYAPAAALTLGLIAATTHWLHTRRLIAGWLWFALACMALLMTFSGWFAVAATGPMLLTVWLLRRAKREALLTAGFGLLLAGLGATVHLTFNRYLSSSDGLQDFWAEVFLPRDTGLPTAAWRMGTSLLAEAWREYPALGAVRWLLLPLAVAGWLVWVWRDRTAGIAVGLVVAVTLAANLAGKWPLGHRMNLPLIALGHLCMVALPVGLVGWWRSRQQPRAGTELNGTAATQAGNMLPLHLSGLALAGAIAMAVLVVHETSQHDFRVADIHSLLSRMEQLGPDDLVVYDGAVELNRQLSDRQLAARALPNWWPQDSYVNEDLLEAIDATSGRVYFASGHMNPPMREQYDAVAKALASKGRWEEVWRGPQVALMELVRPDGGR